MSDVRGVGPQILMSGEGSRSLGLMSRGVSYHVTYPMIHGFDVAGSNYLPHFLQVIFSCSCIFSSISLVYGSTTHSCRTFYYQVETVLILESGDLFCELSAKQCHFE